MKAWERKVLELENSLNSFRESNTERLVGLESVGRENSRKISELEAKINPVNGNVHPENQPVNFKFLFDHIFNIKYYIYNRYIKLK